MASTVKKLGLKPGMQALVVAAPAGYLKSLAPLPDRVEVSETLAGKHDFVQFFATKRSEIEKTAKKLLKSSAPSALVWITYPKRTSGVDSDLSREEVWQPWKAQGGVPLRKSRLTRFGRLCDSDQTKT